MNSPVGRYRGGVAALVLGWVAMPLWAPPVPQEVPDADRLMECAGGNAPRATFRQNLAFHVKNADGTREIQARLLGQRAAGELRVNVKLTAPSDIAGMAVLIQEQAEGRDQLEIYIPGLRKVRRVTERMAQTKLFGTDFSYVEIKQIFGAFLDGQRQYVGEVMEAQRPAHRIRVQPLAESDLPYVAIVATFDAETCVPLAVDFLDADNQIVRRLTGDPTSVIEFSGRHLATKYTLVDRVTDSTSQAVLSNIQYDMKAPASAFSSKAFYEVP